MGGELLKQEFRKWLQDNIISSELLREKDYMVSLQMEDGGTRDMVATISVSPPPSSSIGIENAPTDESFLPVFRTLIMVLSLL